MTAAGEQGHDFSALLDAFKRSIEADKLNWAALDFFDRGPIPFWIKAVRDDGALELIRVNRAFEIQVGVSRASVEGRPDQDVWGRVQAEGVLANDLKVIATGAPVHAVEAVSAPSGVGRWNVWKWPILDAAGRVIAVAGMAEALS